MLKWTLAIALLIILFIVLRKIKKKSEIGNALIGIVVLSLSLYLVFKPVFLSSFLLLNRIELSRNIVKNYTTIFFIEADKKTPGIYDFRTKRSLFRENIKGIEQLQNLQLGDTVIITFKKGLLGFNFDPKIKVE